MLVIFASNVKRSDTHNSLPIFRVLVIFAFSLKTRITRKFPARELLAFYSISFQLSGGHCHKIIDDYHCHHLLSCMSLLPSQTHRYLVCPPGHGPQPSHQWMPRDNPNEKFLLVIEKRDRQQGSGIMKDYHQDDTVSARIIETFQLSHLVSSEAKGSIYILKRATS